MSDPTTLPDAIAALRAVNDQIATMEDELAKRAADLLSLCDRYREQLAVLYAKREEVGDIADKAFADASGARTGRSSLFALDKLTSLLRTGR